MRGLIIVIDTRSCNEKGVSIEEFQSNLRNKLSKFNIEFQLDKSTTDALYTKGYRMFEMENPSENDRADIEKAIEDTFNRLICD